MRWAALLALGSACACGKSREKTVPVGATELTATPSSTPPSTPSATPPATPSATPPAMPTATPPAAPSANNLLWPELRKLIDRYVDKDDQFLRPPLAECSKVLNLELEDEAECGLATHAGGTAGEVAIIRNCGEHLCMVDYYFFVATRAQPYHFHAHVPTSFEVSPDHEYLLVSNHNPSTFYEQFGSPEYGGNDNIMTYRISFRTGRAEPFLECMSPRLSPSQNFYACRSFDGDVMKVPVQGGTPQMVVPVALEPHETIKMGGPFADYPEPVEFLPTGEIQYEIYVIRDWPDPDKAPQGMLGEEVYRRTARWVE